MYCREYHYNLKYDEDLLNTIKERISLIGIVDSYFKSVNGKFRDSNSIEIKTKIHPDYKFYYNFCPFHINGEEYYSFYVDGTKNLFYCLGCGAGGDVFDFLRLVYQLDINEVTKILGAISGLFSARGLTPPQFKIYETLVSNYFNQYELFGISRRKTIYLTKRVKSYLENLDGMYLDENDFRKIANRLCCSNEFVERVYFQTDYYKEKVRKRNLLLSIEEKQKYFD